MSLTAGSKAPRAAPRSAKSAPKGGRVSAPRAVPAVRAWVPVACGFLWAVVLLGAVDFNRFLTALVLSPVGMVAAASAVRAAAVPRQKRRARRGARDLPKVQLPLSAVALAATPVVTVAAIAGAAPAIAALVIVGGITVVALVGSASRQSSWLSLLMGFIAVIGPAVACMSVLLARGQGTNEGVALVGAICAYDAGSFLMGNARSASGGPAGVLFGWVSVGVVAVLVAAMLNPFSGVRPWVLFGSVALLAPAGVVLADRVVGGLRLPALRRIDSLILAGPAWVVGVAVLLHH
jgi:hypothetical protein